jgi:hypothetical protein
MLISWPDYSGNRWFSANNSPVLSKTPNILAHLRAQIRQLSDDSEAASGQSPKLVLEVGARREKRLVGAGSFILPTAYGKLWRAPSSAGLGGGPSRSPSRSR